MCFRLSYSSSLLSRRFSIPPHPLTAFPSSSRLLGVNTRPSLKLSSQRFIVLLERLRVHRSDGSSCLSGSSSLPVWRSITVTSGVSVCNTGTSLYLLFIHFQWSCDSKLQYPWASAAGCDSAAVSCKHVFSGWVLSSRCSSVSHV